MADVEEVKTDSTVDQQLDVVIADKESASDAEEIVKATDRNGFTGTPQVPVPSSSASGEDELGEEAGDGPGSIAPSSARTHGYGAVVASEPAVAGLTGSPERVSISTRSEPAVTCTSESESSSRHGGFWSGSSSWSRRFLPSWLVPESRAANTSIPNVRSRSSLGGGEHDRYVAGTRRYSSGAGPVPDSSHDQYADRYATGTRCFSTGTPSVPEGQVTSTPRRAWGGQAQGTAFSVST